MPNKHRLIAAELNKYIYAAKKFSMEMFAWNERTDFILTITATATTTKPHNYIHNNISIYKRQ